MTSNIIGGVPIYKKKVIIHEMRNGKWVAVYNCYKKQDDDELVKKQKKEYNKLYDKIIMFRNNRQISLSACSMIIKVLERKEKKLFGEE